MSPSRCRFRRIGQDHRAPVVAVAPAIVVVQPDTVLSWQVLATTLHELSGRTGALVRIHCAAPSESTLASKPGPYRIRRSRL